MLNEFKEFAMRGSVLDMAVGVIMGGAFGKIVTSFTNDLIMPPVGLLLGKVDFSNLFLNLGSGTYANLADAKKAGAATINYGVFANTLIDFVIMAFVIFLMVKQVNRFKARPVPADPSTKDCPYCVSAIPLKATRCGHCTSQL